METLLQDELFIALVKALTAVLVAAISAAVPILVYEIKKFFATQRAIAEQRMTVEQRAMFQIMMKQWVVAAEALNIQGLVKDKKAWVLNAAASWADSTGISKFIDVKEIEQTLEAQVWKEINEDNVEKNPALKEWLTS